MKEYRFERHINQKIVDGIMQGYKNYIQERMLKNSQMKISNAYAWVRGNHIEDQIACECEEVGITYTKSIAGYTWAYLRFMNKDSKSLFIVKNGRYFDKDNFPKTKEVIAKKRGDGGSENYLKSLSRINQHVDFPLEPTLFPEIESSGILTLFDDYAISFADNKEARNLQQNYDKFYILTYEIDQAKMISSIKNWMPNPTNDKAYLVEDLTELIKYSSVDFEDLDISVLEHDNLNYEFDSNRAIDYDIFDENDVPVKKPNDEK